MADLIRVALCHMAPELGEVDRNIASLERLLAAAADLGARWIVTPELCLSGYDFAPQLGTDWICAPGQDLGVQRLHAAASARGLALFLGHAVRDEQSGRCYNAVLLLGRGPVQVVHRKIQTIPGVEDWSARGSGEAPVQVDGVQLGLLVCADAWRAEPANSLAAQGARLLLSCAAWPPEPHGPEGCWQRRSQETGLPLLVCNRVGAEPSLDFSTSASVVFDAGARLLAHTGSEEALILVDWRPDTGRVLHSAISVSRV